MKEKIAKLLYKASIRTSKKENENMNLPEPQSMPYHNLINEIVKGNIKIPQFQRNFVWTKEKSAKLLDSIFRGYPIGTFILWKTKESLRSIRNLGSVALPPTPHGDYIQYVLDGQQRLTSLFAAIKGIQVPRENSEDNFSEIYINLAAKEYEDAIITDISGKDKKDILKIVDLEKYNLTYLQQFPKEYSEKIQKYRDTLTGYRFSVIMVDNVSIDVATEIFTRLNVSGKPLSVFEIMVAKTFDEKKNFDLKEKYDALIDKLQDVDYETISDATALQAVSIILKKECSKHVILKLDKSKFIDTWPAVVSAIESTVEYFRNYYRIPVSKLLPYNALIVPFAYFFYRHPDKPTGNKQKYLEDFFWRTSLGGRYSHSLESRIAQDIKKIDSILKDQLPKYDYPVDISPKFVEENGLFSAGRSYIKALLCLYAHNEPKSFSNNSIVRISNDWLKQANSKNYHHFFPRAYLKKQKKYDEPSINHIANITIVDDFLNKREIGDKAPKKYMALFEKKNLDLEKTMKTHLINIKTFGIFDDDYDKFLRKRCDAISKELQKRIIRQDIDDLRQEVNISDREEIELEA